MVDPHGALDRILSRTVTGSTSISTTYYVYGLGLIGEETNGAYAAYHFDSRGSTIALTDITANITDSFSYGPFGELNNPTGSSTTPFQYNGQFGVQTDPNGLLYMRARYYNPAIKRFINQDVLLGNINAGISLNRFAYANGDPISSMDPFGLCAQSDDPAGDPVNLSVSLSAGQNGASQPNSLQNIPSGNALLVTLPDGTQYMPITMVKDYQAHTLGLPEGSIIPIYVPSGVDPDALMSNFAEMSNFAKAASDDESAIAGSELVLAVVFRPQGKYDYKYNDGIQYDQFGNFVFGAASALWGYPSSEIQAGAGKAHTIYTGPSNGPYGNLPVNVQDIQSGYDAMSNGGQLSVVPVP